MPGQAGHAPYSEIDAFLRSHGWRLGHYTGRDTDAMCFSVQRDGSTDPWAVLKGLSQPPLRVELIPQ